MQKPPHLMGYKTFNKDEDLEGEKVERNFVNKKKLLINVEFLPLVWNLDLKFITFHHTSKSTKFNIWACWLNFTFC